MPRKSEGRLATRLVNRMSELGLSSRELSNRTSLSYEHVRKLIRGLAFPSDNAASVLSKVLKIPKAEIEQLATADRFQAKFEDSPERFRAVVKKNVELVPLEAIWPNLSQEQKDSVITFARMLADQNASSKKQK